jgi:hypothetical protein
VVFCCCCWLDCYFANKVWNAQQAGAAAVLVMDNKKEDLITMDSPDDDPVASQYLQNISIPSALISKEFGDKLKAVLEEAKELVTMKLDWRESLPHPDERVEYEFWTNSNDECGAKCDAQVEFVRNFKGVAQILERGGYTQFTPHYITWYCPQAFIDSKQCKAQCINNGRYCAPDPEQDFTKGYDGKQVVIENLRQLCVFHVTNSTDGSLRQPWKWWDFVTDFQIRCPMKENKYGPECAEEVIRSLCKPPNPSLHHLSLFHLRQRTALFVHNHAIFIHEQSSLRPVTLLHSPYPPLFICICPHEIPPRTELVTTCNLSPHH